MPHLNRRQWLEISSLSLAGSLCDDRLTRSQNQGALASPLFDTDALILKDKYHAALAGLTKNVRPVFGFPKPVLIEGGAYPGIWLECGPTEGRAYFSFNRAVDLANHEVFFHHQREDGYLPCWVWFKEKGAGQIQMVVPIAASA